MGKQLCLHSKSAVSGPHLWQFSSKMVVWVSNNFSYRYRWFPFLHIGIGIGIGDFVFFLWVSVSALVIMSISVSVSVKRKFPYRSITRHMPRAYECWPVVFWQYRCNGVSVTLNILMVFYWGDSLPLRILRENGNFLGHFMLLLD